MDQAQRRDPSRWATPQPPDSIAGCADRVQRLTDQPLITAFSAGSPFSAGSRSPTIGGATDARRRIGISDERVGYGRADQTPSRKSVVDASPGAEAVIMVSCAEHASV